MEFGPETTEADRVFAFQYATAWSSGSPGQVAACFAQNGWIEINGGLQSTGKIEIATLAQSYMDDLPDMVVRCVKLEREAEVLKWHWELCATSSQFAGGPERVCIRGYEAITVNLCGLISSAQGYYDVNEYEKLFGI